MVDFLFQCISMVTKSCIPLLAYLNLISLEEFENKVGYFVEMINTFIWHLT